MRINFQEGVCSYDVYRSSRHTQSVRTKLFLLSTVFFAFVLAAHGQDRQDPSPTPTPGAGTSESASKTGSLATVQVVGQDETEADAEESQLATIPGGTSIVRSQKVEESRTATIADVLNLQPGVFAQSAGGNDALRISIRGSGVDRGTGFFRTGILFTFDGLPITGPSGTPFEYFDPLGLQYTEILRGTNAFETGSLNLGGAINYVSNTGYTASPFEGRFEAGSFGYYRGQLSSGYVAGPFDYYVSIDGSTRA
jgi:iron complex outermembrane receptor protein